MCKEVNGFRLKLHYCTPGLVRTSAESTSYKGTTVSILLDPIIIIIVIIILKYAVRHSIPALRSFTLALSDDVSYLTYTMQFLLGVDPILTL